ncbi:MAG: FliA/WhiG family RNA polymerase sigma factor [Candidatus Eremiobacteraeota bacterium]|nr:FliA/WhiG family RNA polymerase sigma factor [Candidatus Eremiobacteraeota bacterium]
MVDTSDLWKKYKELEDEESKNKLIEHYLPFVRQIASMIIKKLRPGVDLDDLTGDGIFGLIRAIDNFDLSRGFKFETYATPVVRGSIYNGLRTLDWVPERTRGKVRAVQRSREKYYKMKGRFPTEEELANELRMSSEEVYDLIADLGCLFILSLEQPLTNIEGENGTIISLIENELINDPLMEVEFSEERKFLEEAIENLNERERYIVSKHYFEGFTFESISHDLGVSKQRISQMHARAVRRMREHLGRMTISDEAIKDFTYEKHPLIPPRWKKKE